MSKSASELDDIFRAALGNRHVARPDNAMHGDLGRYASPVMSHTGNTIVKTAGSGIIYTQPQFFSPIHTPINWQIPSKRKEIYQWQIVDGELLNDDYTYTSIHQFVVDGTACSDSVTDGLMWENPETVSIFSGDGYFKKPAMWGQRTCEDKRSFEFAAYGFHHSFAVTEEHGVYVLDGKWWRKKKKVDYNASYRRAKGIPKNGVEKVRVPSCLIVKKEAKDISLDDYLLTPAPNFAEQSNTGNESAYLIGLCAADGCIKGNGCIHITSNIDDEHVASIPDVLEHSGFQVVKCNTKPHSQSDQACRTTMSGHSIGKQLRKFIVGKLRMKKFTKEVFSFSKLEILHLLGGYFDGDGSYVEDQKIFVANNYSSDMADQIWWMLIRCGIRASIGKYPLSGEHYPTTATHYFRIFIPSSEVSKIVPYMRSNKVPKDFQPKPERELKFFHEENGVRFFCQPIKSIRQFLFTGTGYDMQIDPERSYALSGFKVSNCRFYYENEPKIGTAIDFYSKFPINGFQHECQNRYVKRYYDKLSKKLKLIRWLRIMSHEAHLLGDCFPFAEIDCEICGGSGWIAPNQPCDHKGGTFKRIVVLNPEYTEVYSNPITPDPVIAFIPNEELRAMVQRRAPGYEKLSEDIRKMIMTGKPIRLDNRNVSHIKYGDNGYNRYGISLIRRLFPTLAYKTKLMTAQWIVAERLILPIKVVKVGNEERPASPQDLANVQAQLAQVANDPNLTLVTHHAFELDWFGAAGKIQQLTGEFELINQDILDGLAINKALMNGEGPAYNNAAIGVEVMIDKLESWRDDLAEYVEQKIYLPVAIMNNFVAENEWGEKEYVYPKIKWDIMHLRDQQQYRTFILQLHEKGIVSTQRVLQTFDIDYDEEVELLRYERAKGAIGGAAQPGGGLGGGFGGGAPGGGGALPDLGGGGGGGMPELGGLGGGGGAPGGAPAPMEGGMGGGGATAAPAGGGIAAASSTIANVQEFGGRVLKKKTREQIKKQKERLFKQYSRQDEESGYMRDGQGRVMYTAPERELLKKIAESIKRGEIRYAVHPQFPVSYSGQEYTIDFAVPALKLGIEVDGALFHSTPEQVQEDRQRDGKLANLGWTIVRFTDKEVENKPRQVVETILQALSKKENALKRETA